MPEWRRAIASRLAGLNLPPSREAEVIEELAQHLEDRCQELRAAGLSEDAARHDALSELDEADRAVGLLATTLPGWRATRISPIQALREG